MEQVQVAFGFLGSRQVFFIGQTSGRVLGRETRDVVGRLHRLLQGRR
jgi:hypothetical protein